MGPNTLAGKSALVAVFSAISKVTGLVREVVVAAFLGTSIRADLVYLAFQIPNTARRLLSEGMFSGIFVPRLDRIGQKRPDRLPVYAGSVLYRMTLVGACLSVLGMICSPLIVSVIQPGMDDPVLRAEAILLTRIMCGYFFFMNVAMVLRGLHEHARLFSAPSLMPLVFNVGVLTCIFLVRNDVAHVTVAFAVGIVLGGLFQVLILLFSLGKLPLRLVAGAEKVEGDIQPIPVILAGILVGAPELFLVVNRAFATLVSTGTVAAMDYAVRFIELAVGIAAIPVGMVILPSLARLWGEDKREQFQRLTGRAMTMVLAVCLPASVGLWILRAELVRLLFARGRFDESSVMLTAAVLSIFALGLPVIGVYRILCKGQFATDRLGPAATMVLIGLLVNGLVCLFSWEAMGVTGIAVGWVSGLLVTTMLLLIRQYRLGGCWWHTWVPMRFLGRFFIGSLVMGAVLLLIRDRFAPVHVLVSVGVGCLIYLSIMLIPGPGGPRDWKQLASETLV